MSRGSMMCRRKTGGGVGPVVSGGGGLDLRGGQGLTAERGRPHEVVGEGDPQGHGPDFIQAADQQPPEAAMAGLALTHSAVAARAL